MLIPGSINGEPIDVENFGKLIKSKFPELGDDTGYRIIWEVAKKCRGDGKPHWVLLTKDVLSGSRNKSYAEQKQQVIDESQGNYQVPQAVDVIACIIAEYGRSKTRLFSDIPWTYTRCQEKLEGHQVIVGGFAPAGLVVNFSYFYDFDFLGVAALRKL